MQEKCTVCFARAVFCCRLIKVSPRQMISKIWLIQGDIYIEYLVYLFLASGVDRDVAAISVLTFNIRRPPVGTVPRWQGGCSCDPAQGPPACHHGSPHCADKQPVQGKSALHAARLRLCPHAKGQFSGCRANPPAKVCFRGRV